jgi:cytoskeletal protein RodZ
MSDETPTQRLPEPGGQPTERIAAGELQEDLREEKSKSRGLLIALIAAGALLLVAIIVLVFFLGRATGSSDDEVPVAVDSASPTPGISETPVGEPSTEPTTEPTTAPPATQPPANNPPPANTLKIDTFKVSPTTWTCNTSAPNPVPDPKLSFTWNTSNAAHVYFAVGKVPDAETQGQGWDLPEDGNQASFPDGAEFYFYCPAASQSYTLTAKDAQGHKVTKTVTVVNNGDKQ